MNSFIYAVAGVVSLLISAALVVTQRWHSHFTSDFTVGVQKVHLHPTPRVGGVAVVVGAVVVVGFLDGSQQEILIPLLLASVPAFALGFLEDITKRVGVTPRLLATMLSGVLAWLMTGIAVKGVGVWGVDYLLSFTPVAVAFTAFAIGGVANSINIIDGLNGLAAGVACIILCSLGLIGWGVGDLAFFQVCLLMTALILGFVVVNWPWGKLFLGDGGAYFIGFSLAWLAVLLPARNPEVSVWASLVACAYPIVEVLFSIRRRMARENHHPGQPDRLHFHHLIHRRFAKRFFRKCDRRIQNGGASIFLWCYALIPAIWSVVFYESKLMLVVGSVLFILLYAVLYARLAAFRWSWRIRL